MYVLTAGAAVKIAVMEEQPLFSVLLMFLKKLLCRRLGEGAIVGHGKAVLKAVDGEEVDIRWSGKETGKYRSVLILERIGKCNGLGYSALSQIGPETRTSSE
jgi:hypothetical protein